MKLTVPLAALAAIFTSVARIKFRFRATKKAALLLFAIAVLLASGAATVRGQSALDGFFPNANGAILAVAVQPDGKILIGGSFTTLSPNGGATITRNRIARLNPDGTLDTVFHPDANNTVRAIAVQADGKILIGGDFTVVSGKILRNHIARLDGTTGFPDSFDPNANDIVRAIALQADGKILAGGDFTTLSPNGGAAITRNRIARVNPDGTLDGAFGKANANNIVRAIALQADGFILAGGDFTLIDGQGRGRIARLDPTTGEPDSFHANANNFVNAIAVQADGKILVGGAFTSIGGQTRAGIARLDADKTATADPGAVDLSFHPDPNNIVNAIAVQADSKILVGGVFTHIGGATRNRIARLNATDGAADSFDPNASNFVNAIAVQQDGKILVGGSFATLSPDGGAAVTRNGIARLEIDGRLDQTLQTLIPFPNTAIQVDAIAVQTDDKILIGGVFNSISGMTRFEIARLNTDGTLDTAFDAHLTGNQVNTIAVQGDGNILVGGSFTSIGGQPRNDIARLDATTLLADSFNPNVNPSFQVDAIALDAHSNILVGGDFFGPNSIGGATRNCIARLEPMFGAADNFDPNANFRGNPGFDVVSIAVETGGRILAGGAFDRIGGATRSCIARLDPNTGLADSFNPNVALPNTNGFVPSVSAIAVQMDGRILIGGRFTSVLGMLRNNLVRLNKDGTLDAQFNPEIAFTPSSLDGIDSIAVQADHKILVGGRFTNIGGAIRHNIARLDGTTGMADSFDPNADDAVASIALQADGKILAGGVFNTIGGQSRGRFARLSNDTAALQSLIVTQTSVTLTRGGSSPQFARVTFESSTDNVNFTPIGEATPSGSNWILTGLNLPTGQSLIIRARGFYGSGRDNGSESVLGTRQSAFFPGSFVIGDRNAVVGQRVVFWGAQWAKSNSLSGGSASASFNGFANSTSTNPPTCGGTWQSDPGNNSVPPSGVPANINVIVASSITQSGAVVSGNIPEMAVVQTDPGYDSNPGHAGAGTVVSVSCGR
jgi:uncharacterized delta-60 repeat protein